MKICIDFGHGQDTKGKRTPKKSDGSFIKEHTLNRGIGLKLVSLLKNNGYDVILSNPEMVDVPLGIRCRRANTQKCDLFLSIHCNASGGGWSSANGVESFISSKSDNKTKDIALKIQKGLVKGTGFRDRGVKFSDELYVLNCTNMPAVLIECGFMTNKYESQKLSEDVFQMKIALSLFESITGKKDINCKIDGGIKMRVYNNVSELKEWESVPVKWALKKQILYGDGKQLNLNESELKTIIFMYRDNERKGTL